MEKKVKVCFEIDRSVFERVMFSMGVHDPEKRQQVWDKLCENEIDVVPNEYTRLAMTDREMYTVIICLASCSKREAKGILDEK